MNDAFQVRAAVLVASVAVAILFSAGLHPGAQAGDKGAHAKVNGTSQPTAQPRIRGNVKYNNIVLKRGS